MPPRCGHSIRPIHTFRCWKKRSGSACLMACMRLPPPNSAVGWNVTCAPRSITFDAASLDPDILSERARALLQMAQPEDVIVMTNPQTGVPISGSLHDLAENQATPTIASGID